MSLEALWSVEFRSNLGNLGGGVVMFKTGRVLGGDGSFYFLGDFSVRDGTVSGKVGITQYNRLSPSVFGGNCPRFDLTFAGRIGDKKMRLYGHLADDPSMRITVNCVRRAELPN